MKCVLVGGAGGFIGGHLVKKFAARKANGSGALDVNPIEPKLLDIVREY